MKISPLAPQGQGAQAPAPMRSFKMNTNATPEGLEPQPGEPSTSPQDGAGSEVTQPLSPQMAAIAKQRRALQVKEREIAQREQALKSQPSGIDLAQLKSDPLGTLLANGVTYEQLTEAVLANQANPEIAALQAKIKELEEGVQKTFTDRDAQQEQQVLAEMKREATALVAQGDTYELVRTHKAVPSVIELIHRTYKESGEVMAVPEALRLVEEQLLEDSLKYAGLKKVQERLAPPPAPVPPPQSQRQTRTLTNRDTAQVPMSRTQRALAAFNGTLRR